MLFSQLLDAQQKNLTFGIDSSYVDEIRTFRELGGIGLGSVSFRDFATSPLIYSGTAIGFKSSKTKISRDKESKFGVDVLLGLALSSVAKETSVGIIINFDINYSQLYTIEALSTRGWETKVGGALSVLFVNRLNNDLRNNALGFEFFPTLFGSIKTSKDFTRHLPLRKKKGSRHQSISFQLDVGLLNTNFRNGYAYTTHSPFYNGTNIFENHQFNIFSGLRIRSAVDYILYARTTKNAIKISYNWTCVRSGENPDRFTMSNGVVSFSYLYRVN